MPQEPFTPAQVRQFQRQMAEHGLESLVRSLASLQRRLAEHVEKLEQQRAAGGYTTSLEREVLNFRQQIEAIDEVLRRAAR